MIRADAPVRCNDLGTVVEIISQTLIFQTA